MKLLKKGDQLFKQKDYKMASRRYQEALDQVMGGHNTIFNLLKFEENPKIITEALKQQCIDLRKLLALANANLLSMVDGYKKLGEVNPKLLSYLKDKLKTLHSTIRDADSDFRIKEYSDALNLYKGCYADIVTITNTTRDVVLGQGELPYTYR
jgi:hypothetical protein